MLKKIFSFLLLPLAIYANAEPTNLVNNLQKAYPENIDKTTSRYIFWKDGTRTPIRSSSALVNWFNSLFNSSHQPAVSISNDEIWRDRSEPFFRKMYGNSAKEVKKKLVTIYWMPHVFGSNYPLKVTTVNGVNKKLQQISAELEQLPPSYYKYVDKPASSFNWRNVAGESYLSLHSFGIAIDINLNYSNYWLWDFLKLKRPFSDLRAHKIIYQNKIPQEIVRIFAKHGFFWGGNWYFYDTMHFEYRPELLITA